MLFVVIDIIIIIYKDSNKSLRAVTGWVQYALQMLSSI